MSSFKFTEEDLEALEAEAEKWKIKYPITIKGVEFDENYSQPPFQPGIFQRKIGGPVAIRPCFDETKGKTFLGFYLGDVAVGVSVSFNQETEILTVMKGAGNPAIWVPDLGKVVMGYESWWGVIKSPEDMKQITDTDINSVWYVKALKEISE